MTQVPSVEMSARAFAPPEESPWKPGNLELFRSLSAPALDAVRAAMRVDRVAKGEAIFVQGERADRAYALGAGSIRIMQIGSDGGQAIVRFIAPGETFGAVPLFTDHRLPAAAIAAEDSVVLSWSEGALRELIGLYPPIAINVIEALGTRLGQLQERLRELTTQRVERRIAHAVLRLAAQAGRDTSGGTTIAFPLRRKDIAEFSGTTLHTASRTLAAWEKAGLLASGKGQLTIRDPDGLRCVAEDCAT